MLPLENVCHEYIANEIARAIIAVTTIAVTMVSFMIDFLLLNGGERA